MSQTQLGKHTFLDTHLSLNAEKRELCMTEYAQLCADSDDKYEFTAYGFSPKSSLCSLACLSLAPRIEPRTSNPRRLSCPTNLVYSGVGVNSKLPKRHLGAYCGFHT